MGGIIIQSLTFGLNGPATSMANDLTEGIVDRFRSLPARRSAYLSGHFVAELAGLALCRDLAHCGAHCRLAGAVEPARVPARDRPPAHLLGRDGVDRHMDRRDRPLGRRGDGHRIHDRVPAHVRQQRLRSDPDHADGTPVLRGLEPGERAGPGEPRALRQPHDADDAQQLAARTRRALGVRVLRDPPRRRRADGPSAATAPARATDPRFPDRVVLSRRSRPGARRSTGARSTTRPPCSSRAGRAAIGPTGVSTWNERSTNCGWSTASSGVSTGLAGAPAAVRRSSASTRSRVAIAAATVMFTSWVRRTSAVNERPSSRVEIEGSTNRVPQTLLAQDSERDPAPVAGPEHAVARRSGGPLRRLDVRGPLPRPDPPRHDVGHRHVDPLPFARRDAGAPTPRRSAPRRPSRLRGRRPGGAAPRARSPGPRGRARPRSPGSSRRGRAT